MRDENGKKKKVETSLPDLSGMSLNEIREYQKKNRGFKKKVAAFLKGIDNPQGSYGGYNPNRKE